MKQTRNSECWEREVYIINFIWQMLIDFLKIFNILACHMILQYNSAIYKYLILH